MKEIERQVKVFRIDAQCEHCKKGFLMFQGRTRPFTNLTVPNAKPRILFIHLCTHCKAEKPLNRQYPYFVNRVIEEENKLTATNNQTGG